MEIRETIVISISDQFWNAEGGRRGADNKEQDGDVFDNELGYNFRDFDAHGGWKDEKKEEEEDQDEVEDDSVDVKDNDDDDDDGVYDDDTQNDKDDDITIPNGGSTQVASEMVPGLNCP